MTANLKRKRQRPPINRAHPPGRQWFLPIVASVVLLAGIWVLRSANPMAGLAQDDSEVVRSLHVDVLRTIPHDTTAYTQGLLWWRGKLYESTGQYGASTLRRVDPDTGLVEQRLDIAPGYFGEGLALVDEQLVQLTWKAQRAFVYELDDFTAIGTHRYIGEGWGLCHDGTRLIMSDGSDTLVFRDPSSFTAIGSVRVTLRGLPQSNLNELECVDDVVYANIWQHDEIVRVDPTSGRVTDHIDAAGLLTADEARGTDVLNGIAYNANAGTFYLTGKLWPKMFEVSFVD